MKNYVYTPSSTDVTIRWRRLYGYVPASEQEFYQQKWAKWRQMLAKGIESLEPAEVQIRLDKMRRVK